MSTKPEQQLKVGDWWYLPQQDKLVQFTAEGEIARTAELDNLCQKALNYFLMNPGRLVTRDELLLEVWGVRDVSDGRISRVIRVLRVVLGDDSREPLYIETIPKRGFRFVAPVLASAPTSNKPIAVPQPSMPAEPAAIPLRRLTPYVVWSVFAALVSCSLIYLGWSQWRQQHLLPVEIPFARFEPISSMDGLEFYPSTSADGRYIAYTHVTNLDGHSALMVQDLQTLEKRQLKSSEQFNLIGPIWHPQGLAVVYQQLRRKVSCEIRILRFDAQFNVLSDQKLTSCGTNSMGARMSWSPDGRFLVFPDWPEHAKNISLMLYAFEGGNVEQLTMPPETSLGDFAVAFAPDGRRLAFLRDVAGAAGQIWTMDINDRSSQLVYQPNGIYPGQIAWMPDQHSILFPSGNNELSVIDLATKQSRIFAYTDNKAGEVLINPQGRIFASVGKLWQSSIRRLNNPLKNPTPVNEVMQQASQSEGLLELNPQPDGPTAVVSNRSGIQQVWLYFNDGRQKQISRFTADFIPKSLEFSPDGRRLLVLVGTSVWLLSEDNAPILLSKPEQASRDPSWSHDSKTIYFSASEQGFWRVVALDSQSLNQRPFAADMDFFRESPNGNYQVWRNSQDKTLWLKFRDSEQALLLNKPLATLLPLPDASNFRTPYLVLRDSAIYFLATAEGGKSEIHRFDLVSQQVKSTGISQPKLSRRFTVSQDELFIFQDDGKTGDIDIAELVFPKSIL